MQVSNTLTRWHKVVERINASIQEKELAIQYLGLSNKTSTVENFDLVVKNVNVDLQKAESLFSERMALAELAFTIRSKLAHANVDHGVSNLLCEIEMLRKSIAAMGVFVAPGNTFEQTQEIVARKVDSLNKTMNSTATNAFDIAHREKNETLRFSIITDEMKKTYENKIQEAKMRIIALNDKLSDVNATKLSIEVDKDVAKMVGLS